MILSWSKRRFTEKNQNTTNTQDIYDTRCEDDLLSFLAQEKLSNLAILNIENEIMDKLNIGALIDKFASSRRKQF